MSAPEYPFQHGSPDELLKAQSKQWQKAWLEAIEKRKEEADSF